MLSAADPAKLDPAKRNPASAIQQAQSSKLLGIPN
jgi:hypothetical protein